MRSMAVCYTWKSYTKCEKALIKTKREEKEKEAWNATLGTGSYVEQYLEPYFVMANF